MSDASTHLLLPFILASQAQKHVTHNEALRLLDGLVQLSVKDRDLAAPPGAPSDGDRYLVASGASGAWSGWDLNIAYWVDGAWMKLVPREGWLLWVEDEDLLLVLAGTSWRIVSTAAVQLKSSGEVYSTEGGKLGSSYCGYKPSGSINLGSFSSVGTGMKLYAGSSTNPFQFFDSAETLMARLDPTTNNFLTTLQTRAHADARYVLQSSSQRYKEDITPAPVPDLSGLAAKIWIWGGELELDDDRIGRQGYGLIAEELARVAPHCVTRDALGRIEGINALATIGAIIAYYNQQIAALEARIRTVEGSNP